MSYTAVEDAILVKLIQVWTQPFDGEVLAYTLENNELETENTWARFTIQPAASILQGIGSVRRYQRDGLAIVQIFTPVSDPGTHQSNLLVDRIVAAFEGKETRVSVPGVKKVDFLDIVPTKVGADQKWFQQNVDIQYRWYENK